MTDDIVARLRTWSADESTWDLLTEAADEIERLRERRDDWRAAMTENHDLWNENERLRAALREKDNIAYIIDSHGMTHQSFVIVYSAALAGEKANDAAT